MPKVKLVLSGLPTALKVAAEQVPTATKPSGFGKGITGQYSIPHEIHLHTGALLSRHDPVSLG